MARRRSIMNVPINVALLQTEPDGAYHVAAMCTGGQSLVLEEGRDASTPDGRADIADESQDRCIGEQPVVRDRYPALLEAWTMVAGDHAARVFYQCADGRLRSEPVPEGVMGQINDMARQRGGETKDPVEAARALAAAKVGAEYAEAACEVSPTPPPSTRNRSPTYNPRLNRQIGY